MAGKGISRKRGGSFMDKPKDGWLHDPKGLAIGRGVYCSYQVKYLGNIELRSSLRSLPPRDQTRVMNEAIALVADQGHRPAEKRELHTSVKSFGFGKTMAANIAVTFSISACDMIIAPPNAGLKGDGSKPELDGIIECHKMNGISLAAGGENMDYELVSYVAKEAGVRKAFVFACGEAADDVLATIGQAFNLAMDLARKRKENPKPKAKKTAAPAAYDKGSAPPVVDYSVGDDSAPPVDYAEGAAKNYIDVDGAPAEPTYDIGKVTEQYMDVKEERIYDNGALSGVEELEYLDTGDSPIYDTAQGGVDDITSGVSNLLSLDSIPEEPLYDTASEASSKKDQAALDLVQKLNDQTEKKEKKNKLGVSLKNTSGPDLVSRPTWVYFKPKSVRKKLDISAVKAAQGQ